MTKKARFIEQLTSLSAAEKERLKDFFTKNPLYENRVDWNDKSLNRRDFEEALRAAGKSRKTTRQRQKDNPGLLFEGHNCQIIADTEEFLIINPLDWECAVFFNSFKCGGEGAKWCIGDKLSPETWEAYMGAGSFFYFVFFKKKNLFFGKKIIMVYNINTEETELWLQNDRRLNFEIFACFLRQRYYICAQDPGDKQLSLDFDNVLIDNKKCGGNIFLLQLVKKAYETAKPDEYEEF